MTSTKTILFASLIAAMILPFSGMITAQAEEDYQDTYESDQYITEVNLSWYVQSIQSTNERLEIIQKAHSSDIIDDSDYFFELLMAWESEKYLKDEMSEYYDLDSINTDDAKYIKNAIENPVAKKLLDVLLASK